MSYDDNNRGAIWKNERKEKDTHPDFTGSAKIDGVDYWVSAWKRKPDASAKAPALSFSVKLKEDSRKPEPTGNDFDDSIPFAPRERNWIA